MKTLRLTLSLFACSVSAQNVEGMSFLDLTETNEAEDGLDNLIDLTSEYNDLSNYGYHHHNPYAEYVEHHVAHPELDHDRQWRLLRLSVCAWRAHLG